MASFPFWAEHVGLYQYLGIEVAIWMLYALGYNLGYRSWLHYIFPITDTAPELGQDTEAVLLELGYDWDAIVELKGSPQEGTPSPDSDPRGFALCSMRSTTRSRGIRCLWVMGADAAMAVVSWMSRLLVRRPRAPSRRPAPARRP